MDTSVAAPAEVTVYSAVPNETTAPPGEEQSRGELGEKNASFDTVNATGSQAAGVITHAVERMQDTDAVFEQLGNADLTQPSVEQAFGDTTAEGASEDLPEAQFLKPAANGQSEAIDHSQGEEEQTNGKIIDLTARREQRENQQQDPETSENQESRQEHRDEKEKLQETQDNPTAELKQFLEENPDVRDLVKKIMSVSDKRREKLLEELHDKVDKVIKEEKNPKKKERMSILYSILLFILGEFLHTMEEPDKLAA